MMRSVLYSRKLMEQLRALDRCTRTTILKWIGRQLADGLNPLARGEALAGEVNGNWHYRVGDYRLIANIAEDKILLLALVAGHRV